MRQQKGDFFGILRYFFVFSFCARLLSLVFFPRFLIGAFFFFLEVVSLGLLFVQSIFFEVSFWETSLSLVFFPRLLFGLFFSEYRRQSPFLRAVSFSEPSLSHIFLCRFLRVVSSSAPLFRASFGAIFFFRVVELFRCFLGCFFGHIF